MCGFVLQRRLKKLGCVCQVIAPSLVLRKPGERACLPPACRRATCLPWRHRQAADRWRHRQIKTDRRDAKKLLSQFIAGQLTQVHAPDAAQEADRELTRCRYSAQEDLQRARQQLNSLLVRHCAQ